MEYYVINTEHYGSDALQSLLNNLSKEGWRVICDTKAGLILGKSDHAYSSRLVLTNDKATSFSGLDGL